MRYISNHSSGKQGHAIAAALAALGAETVLVSGPTQEPIPAGVRLVAVETAREMLAASEAALPVDVAVMAAAVADWRVEAEAGQKIKKDGKGPPTLRLAENPDILATLAGARQRPAGARRRLRRRDRERRRACPRKRARKGCDWILANDVSPGTGTFGGDRNTIHLVDAGGVEDWPVDDQARGRRPPRRPHRRPARDCAKLIRRMMPSAGSYSLALTSRHPGKGRDPFLGVPESWMSGIPASAGITVVGHIYVRVLE